MQAKEFALFVMSLVSVADDVLDFKLLFAINQIRRWA
jgi:hypothetical protein